MTRRRKKHRPDEIVAKLRNAGADVRSIGLDQPFRKTGNGPHT